MGQSWPRLSQYAAQIPLPVCFIHHSIIYLRNPKISSFNPSLLLNTTLPYCFELLVRAICGLLPTRASQDLMHIPSMKSCKQKSLPTLIHSSPHHLKLPSANLVSCCSIQCSPLFLDLITLRQPVVTEDHALVFLACWLVA